MTDVRLVNTTENGLELITADTTYTILSGMSTNGKDTGIYFMYDFEADELFDWFVCDDLDSFIDTLELYKQYDLDDIDHCIVDIIETILDLDE